MNLKKSYFIKSFTKNQVSPGFADMSGERQKKILLLMTGPLSSRGGGGGEALMARPLRETLFLQLPLY